MAAWPDTEELAQVLDLENVDDWETTIDRVLASAISIVKIQRGNWDEYEDEPTEQLAQAALRMGELLSSRPGVAQSTLIADPTFQTLMFGQRRRFGIA